MPPTIAGREEFVCQEINVEETEPRDVESPESPPEPEAPLASAPLALPAAAGGALVGALVWAVLAYSTGYEIGYLAWGIGLLVGGGCVWVGGRGQNMAVACAGLALAGILLGKVLAVNFVVQHEIDQMTDQYMTPAAYAERQTDAADFAGLPATPSDDEIRAFMVSHAFTDSQRVESVSDIEVEDFLGNHAPALREFAAEQPSYEEWRDAFGELALGEFSTIEAIQQDLNFIDLLFAFLGVSTAYGLVMRSSTPPPRRRRARRPSPAS